MSISRARSGLNIQSTTPQLLCTSLAIVTSHYTGAGFADNSWVHPLTQMAPKLSFRATLIAFLAALSLLVFLAAPVSAQCQCTYGVISYDRGALCWSSGPGSGSYVTLPYNNYQYKIYCQRTGGYVNGNNWWNRVIYNGQYCYVNDYYMTTGCPTRCYNLPIC